MKGELIALGAFYSTTIDMSLPALAAASASWKSSLINMDLHIMITNIDVINTTILESVYFTRVLVLELSSQSRGEVGVIAILTRL